MFVSLELKVSPETAPVSVLERKLPLVASFIQSVWARGHVSVWGLSALGRPLESKSRDEVFIDEGPESQGWVVRPEGGVQDGDLCLPLAWLLGTSP